MRTALFVVMLAVLALTGCQKDIRGTARLNVQTTFPPDIPVMLVSQERTGTYVQKVNTDTAGILRFIGIVPGRYKLIYQFSAPTLLPSDIPYNYGESPAFDVKAGTNAFEWTIGAKNSTIQRRE